MFAFTEMFFDCLISFCLDTLGIERVQKITQNLEHNSYAHHQNTHHVITLAIVGYLVQDVIWPPPDLLLRNFDVYMAQVDTAGGIVLLRYLRHAGFPVLQWQRAARYGDGLKLKKLLAYSFHIFRSVCHKPVCAQICLIGLLGFCCALPALQTVLLCVVSASMTGRRLMYLDRLLELINKVQGGSMHSSRSASFGHAVDMTSLLRSIIHVQQTFQAAENMNVESDEPVTVSMLVQARILQDLFVQKLGLDLTVHRSENPFWHTGNPVPLDTGDFRSRRPWEWPKAVWLGSSSGKSRATSEGWIPYVRRFVFDHFFPF